MSGYPIILGGDHVAFEQEWAASGKPVHMRPDWPLPSFDARDWAAEFCRIAKEVHGIDLDEGWMIAWFANALMRGYDQRSAEQSARSAVTVGGRIKLAWAVLCGRADAIVWPAE